MICTDAEVNRVCFLNSHTVWVFVIINQLSNPVGLANRNNSTLGSQNGWYEVSPSDVTTTWDAEGSIVEVCLSETTVDSLIWQVLQISVNLENALVLDSLDVGDGKAIGAVDGNAEVVVVLHHVALNIAIVI